MQNFGLYFLLFFAACTNKYESQVSENTDAKWYYYCFASRFSASTKDKTTISSLACDVKQIKMEQISADTLFVFFSAFYKDSNNICSIPPYGLSGIQIIRDRIFLPIYHVAVFDSLANDSATFAYMKRAKDRLVNKIKEEKDIVNSWLKMEVKRRKSSK